MVNGMTKPEVKRLTHRCNQLFIEKESQTMATVPRKGDKAFAGSADIALGMTFLRLIGLDRSYAKGFKNAADTLIASILGDNIHLRFPMVIPACFLYRHYLELEMKYLLVMGSRLKFLKVTDEDLEIHQLHPLWNTTSKVITTLVPDEPKRTQDQPRRDGGHHSRIPPNRSVGTRASLSQAHRWQGKSSKPR